MIITVLFLKSRISKYRIVGLLLSLVLCPFLSLTQGSGNTLTFDGNSDFIDIGDQVANQCRTIELWFKPSVSITSSNTVPKSLIIRDYNNASGQNTNEFGLAFYPNTWAGGTYGGKLVFMRRVGNTIYEVGSDNDFWEANHWYHVCATIDPTSGVKMYINGILQQDTDPTTSPIGTQTGTQWDKVSIGRWGNLNIRYFNGEIDEIRLWETERTQQEVRDKMCSSLAGNEPGLRAYWNFDTGTGTTLVDNSVNSYAGILQSMTNANWIYSGAPIGDISTHSYPGNLSGTSTTLNSGVGDEFMADNFISSAEGVQIYKVNSLPNVVTNLNSPTTNNYYGIFLTSTNGTYNASYDYSMYVCSSCDEIFTRNDNSDLNWQQLVSSPQNCEFNLINESSVGYDYRAEYIINTGIVGLGNFLGNDTTLCLGSNLVLDPQEPSSTFLWQDNSIGSTFTVTQPGIYWVEVTNNCGVFIDSLYVDYTSPPIVDLGNDTLLCQNANLLLDPGVTGVTFLWQDNSTDSTFTVTQTGLYCLEVTNNCGVASDTIEIIFGSLPNVDFGNDTTICEGESLNLDATTVFSNYQWQDGSLDSTYSITQSGLYWAEVSNACGVDSDSIIVSVTPLPLLDLGNDTTICEGETILLESTTLNANVIWQDGSNNPTYIVSQTGLYYGLVTLNDCTVSDTIEVTVLSLPTIDLGTDTLICEGDNIVLSPEAIGSYTWNTGSSEPILIVSSFGEYSVAVTNQCGSATGSILVGDLDCSCTYYVPNTFSPDGGEFNEEFGFIYDCDLYSFAFEIYNRWGEIIYESFDPDSLWDGTFQGHLVQTGTYTYKIEIVTDKGISKTILGHVNVLY